MDRQPVYTLTLMPIERPTGTPADSLAVVHTFKELFDAPLKPGDWLACVFQDGQLEKVIRAGDQSPIIDTSLDITVDDDVEITDDPEGPLGFRFGSYAPFRPWSLGLALDFVLDERPKHETGCPLCGNDDGELEDFTLRCPDCTGGLRHSAEVIIVDHSGVEDELAFGVLSRLETNWLLSQIPKEVEAPA